ncbi:MAG: hypothetical protein K6T35_05415, partial [Meiothermus silvanus]|nr:hypothetical protein [Allomeiothermus silvanus]
IAFDVAFLDAELARLGRPPLANPTFDTLPLAVALLPRLRRPNLDAVADALGVMAPRRLPAPYANVPTLKELGYNVDWIVWRGFYVPKSIPPDAYEFWIQALRKVAKSPEWAKVREQNSLGEFLSLGAEFQVFVDRQVNAFRSLSRELGLIK